MILSYELFFNPIDLDQRVLFITIEDKTEYRRLLQMIQRQSLGENGSFIISEHYEPIDFSKKVAIITDVITMDFTERSITSGILKEANLISLNDIPDTSYSVLSAINHLGDEIVCEFDEDILYKPISDIGPVLKLLGLHMDLDSYSPAERIVEYIKSLKKYSGKEVFIIANIAGLFDDEELKKIVQALYAYHLDVIIIDSVQPGFLCDEMQQITIDKDLCQI